MNELDHSMARIGQIKEKIAELKQLIDPLTSEEDALRNIILSYMIDNDIQKGVSPDGKYTANRSVRTAVSLNDRGGLTNYLIMQHPDLLSPNLVEIKKSLKDDEMLAGYFTITKEPTLTISLMTEKVPILETPAEFRKRVRGE